MSTTVDDAFEAKFHAGGRYSGLTQVEQGYLKLDRAMWHFYKAGKHEDCDEVAERLLLQPQLPFMLRARALIVLSTRLDGCSVERAQKAYNLMDLDVRQLCEEEGAPFPSIQFAMAKQVLEEAIAWDEDHKSSEGGGPDAEEDIAATPGKDNSAVQHRAEALGDQLGSLVVREKPASHEDMEINDPIIPTASELMSNDEAFASIQGSQLRSGTSEVVAGDADRTARAMSRHGLYTPAASREVSSLEEPTTTLPLTPKSNPPSKGRHRRRFNDFSATIPE